MGVQSVLVVATVVAQKTVIVSGSDSEITEQLTTLFGRTQWQLDGFTVLSAAMEPAILEIGKVQSALPLLAAS